MAVARCAEASQSSTSNVRAGCLEDGSGVTGLSVLGLGAPRLPHDMFRSLELERRVVDVEVVGKASAKVIEDIASLSVGAQDDMRRHDIHATRDRPGVEIVDVVDPRSIEDVLAHMVEI